MKYTFFYVIGGSDIYYEQLQKSIRSLTRLNIDYKVKILDFGGKLSGHDNIEVVHLNKEFDISSQRHIFYQYKYFICQQLDTEFGIYLDCDTVICSDKIESIFNKLDSSFGIIQHFCIGDFYNSLYYFGSDFTRELQNSNYLERNNVNPNGPFATGGVFFFQNNKNSLDILRETFELHNTIYKDVDKFINGFFDETFLSTVIQKHDYKLVHGSANHCCANHMPLKLENGKLLGKNPSEKDYEEILVFHGFSERQIKGLDFTGELQLKIQEIWNI